MCRSHEPMLRTALLMLCLMMTVLAMRANDGAMPGHSLAAMEVQHDEKEGADGKFCDMCDSIRVVRGVMFQLLLNGWCES